MRDWIEGVAFTAAIILPLFNIPLVLRLIKRKSSRDISVYWAVGVWVCIVLMTPQSLRSEDITFRTFGIMNICLFSLVTFFTLKYRNNKYESTQNE